jgi:hypothetical protein
MTDRVAVNPVLIVSNDGYPIDFTAVALVLKKDNIGKAKLLSPVQPRGFPWFTAPTFMCVSKWFLD